MVEVGVRLGLGLVSGSGSRIRVCNIVVLRMVYQVLSCNTLP